MQVLFLLMALIAGAALASQVAINSQLKTIVGTPIQATCVSLCIGAMATLAYSTIARQPWPRFGTVAESPWWAWSGGLLGIFYLWATVVTSPRLGVAMTFGLVIAGQVVTSMLLDHFGLFGVPVHPASSARLIGILLVIAGVAVMFLSRH